MNWKWWQNIVGQWQTNPRLRYAVLIVLVILAVHGILKLADRRDALVMQWTKDQELVTRLQEVSRQPQWPARARAAEGRLRETVGALPLANTLGQARADLHMWLGEQARRAGVRDFQVTVETPVEVPEEPGLIQVVGRLEASDLSWKLVPLLRRLALGLPWRQAQRMEVLGGDAGKLSVIVRSHHRDSRIQLPDVSASTSHAVPTPVANVKGASSPAVGVAVAGPSDKPPASPADPSRRRELPVPRAVSTPRRQDDEGIVQGVMQPAGKPPANAKDTRP